MADLGLYYSVDKGDFEEKSDSSREGRPLLSRDQMSVKSDDRQGKCGVLIHPPLKLWRVLFAIIVTF